MLAVSGVLALAGQAWRHTQLRWYQSIHACSPRVDDADVAVRSRQQEPCMWTAARVAADDESLRHGFVSAALHPWTY